MLLERKKKGLNFKWKTGEEVFLWWIEDKNISGQQDFQIGKTGEISSIVVWALLGNPWKNALSQEQLRISIIITA